MQVLIQSYRRLKYLKRTVESIRQDDVEVLVVDGGSDMAMVKYIKQVADRYLLFKDNPGADFLKNEGIKQLVTEDAFVLSADDIEYPKGYSMTMLDQFKKLNSGGSKFAFCSANMAAVESQKLPWKRVNGVEIYLVTGPQSASAMVSKNALMEVGLYPEYGKYGAGDWAMGRMLLRKRYCCCYTRAPIVVHLGINNYVDYPEFQKAAEIDIALNYKKAIGHG